MSVKDNYRKMEAEEAMRAWQGFGPDDEDAPANNGAPMPNAGFETCPKCGGNGFVKASRPEPEPEKPKQKGGPTDKQLAFVRELLKEREGNELAEEVRADLNRWREGGVMTGSLVSNAIGRLLKIPKNRRPMAGDNRRRK